MTDTEIIKALECCNDGWNCESCAFDDEDKSMSECTSKLAKAALDLIQRQQERIERLKDNLEAVLKERAALDVDRVVAELEAEKYKGIDGLESIKIAFNFGINKALDIVQGVSNDDR